MMLVISAANSKSGKGLNHDVNQEVLPLIRYQQTHFSFLVCSYWAIRSSGWEHFACQLLQFAEYLPRAVSTAASSCSCGQSLKFCRSPPEDSRRVA